MSPASRELLSPSLRMAAQWTPEYRILPRFRGSLHTR